MSRGPRVRVACNAVMRRGLEMNTRPHEELNLGAPKGHAFQACAITTMRYGLLLFPVEHLRRKFLFLLMRYGRKYYKTPQAGIGPASPEGPGLAIPCNTTMRLRLNLFFVSSEHLRRKFLFLLMRLRQDILIKTKEQFSLINILNVLDEIKTFDLLQIKLVNKVHNCTVFF